MYVFYLDGVAFPVAPEALKLKIKNQNKTVELASGMQLNILNAAGLTEIEFDALLPQVKYPFSCYPNGFKGAEYYMSLLERLKNGKKPFRFIVSRAKPNGKKLFDTNLLVSLEDYDIDEDVDEGMDVKVSIALKQYIPVSIRTIDLPAAPQPVEVPPEQRAAPASSVRTYTVVHGDSMWAIAQKCMGNGSLYKQLYEMNREQIDARNAQEGTSKYTIYTGQVLRLE